MAPKLTPEEKKALKAAKKEEKKRQQIEQAKQVKRDYLGRELKYGELTIKRHEKSWRKMLEELALPKMRQDLELAWHNFERVVDCKNFTISLLMDAIRDAEEQKMKNLSCHMDNIDKLIELLHERLDELEMNYENEIFKLYLREEEVVKELHLHAEEEETYYKTMVFMLKKARVDQVRQIRSDHFTKFEELRMKHKKRANPMKAILVTKLKDITNQALHFIHHYQHTNTERKKEYDRLKVQDDELQKPLADQLETIRKKCDYINILKVKLSDSQKLLECTLKEVKDGMDFFEYVFSTLKKKLQDDTKHDAEKIAYLTVSCNENMDYLSELRNKVERVVRISAVCRRLETANEKVKPFPVVVSTEYILAMREMRKEHIPELELFWQRVGQADASRYAINEERECLRKENEYLISKIHEYNCRCVTCPVPEMNAVTKGVKHITEGALEQKKYEKQNVSQFNSRSICFDIDE